MLRAARRGSFSEEPHRDELLDVAEPFWQLANSVERAELRRGLAALGFDDATLIEALTAYAYSVVQNMPQRPFRPPGPPPAAPPALSLEAPLRVALARVPEGKQVSRGEIGKAMRRYWADCSPMTRAGLTVLLREAGFTGEGSLASGG